MIDRASPQQLTFGELSDGEPQRRLFFGLWPDAGAAESLTQLMARLRRDGVMRGKLVDADPLHLTLHHLGDFAEQIPPSLPPSAKEAATTVTLRDFRQVLSTALVKAGLRRYVKTAFTPHVTLSYSFSDAPETPIQPIGWSVRGFVLVESLLGQHKHIRQGVRPI